MTETQLDIPDLTAAKDILLESRYRIGDVVAVLLMASLIDKHCGRKQWLLVNDNPLFGKLAKYKPETRPHIAWMEYGTRNPETFIPLPDDGRLWIWNDVCHTIGHRLDFVPTVKRPYRVVFAPLWEADYAAERCLHPYFVRDLARNLSQFPDTVLLLPERFNVAHDFELVREIPITKIHAPLSEAIEIIGNAQLFIGGDTGLSHIAGMFPNVKQIALHDRLNTLRHIEREFDHMKGHREFVLEVCKRIGIDVTDAQYRSFPNKQDARCILFDDGGQDGVTMKTVIQSMGRMV